MKEIFATPDEQIRVVQESRDFYRVHLGDVAVSYDTAADAWYVRLPSHKKAHEKADLPCRTITFCDWSNGGVLLNIDVDTAGEKVLGIEIVSPFRGGEQPFRRDPEEVAEDFRQEGVDVTDKEVRRSMSTVLGEMKAGAD